MPTDQRKAPPVFSGGVPREVIQRIENIEQSRGDLENYGLVKLTDSSSVTAKSGLVLPAAEKNPAVEGSVASQIAALRSIINILKQPEVVPSSLGLKETLIGILNPEKFIQVRNRKYVFYNPSVFGWYVADITMWGSTNNWNFNGILYPNTMQDGYLFHYHIPTYQFDLWKISNGPEAESIVS